MKSLFLLSIFALILACVYGGSAAHSKFDSSEKVANLTNLNYGDAINEFVYSLILFYAPNATNSNKTLTQYFKAAEQASIKFPGIRFCQMDANAYPDYAKMVEAKKLPAIKLFDQGSDDHRNYTGNVTAESLLKWLKTQMEVDVVEMNDGGQIEDFASATEHVGLYIGSYKSEAYSTFLAVSTVFSDIEFIRSSDEDLLPEEDAGNDVFVLYRSFNKESSKFRGKFEFEALKNFTRMHKFQSVMTLDKTAFKRIFTDKETACILLRNNEGEADDQAQAEFIKIGSQFRQKIALAVSGIQDAYGSAIAKYLGITADDAPTVVIIDYDNKMAKYKIDREVTAKNTKMFLLNFFSDNLVPFYKSLPIPAPEYTYDGNIQIVVGHNFQRVVSDPDKHVLIELYSPTCGRCQEFAPIYASIAEQVSQIEDLVVAKLDGSVNDAPGVSVEYFPMIFFYPKNAKDTPIEYIGGRTESEVLEFLNQHVTIPILT